MPGVARDRTQSGYPARAGALGVSRRSEARGSFGERHLSSDSVPPSSQIPARVLVTDKQAQLSQYPCESCHEFVTWVSETGLMRHPEVQVRHFRGAEQCSHCHDPEHVNRLRILDGSSVPLYRSPEACGQCHASQFEDWTRGAHGKTVGSWSGERHRYTCPECHDPHQPKFRTVNAFAPPPRPPLSINKAEHHD
jgi:hypothetical protein